MCRYVSVCASAVTPFVSLISHRRGWEKGSARCRNFMKYKKFHTKTWDKFKYINKLALQLNLESSLIEA